MTSEQLNNQIDSRIKEREIQNQFQVVPIAAHTHNGVDSSSISFTNIVNKNIAFAYTLPGATAATSGNYSIFFISPVATVVQGIQEVHTTAGTDSGTVTLNVEKLTGTTAPGSGTNLIATALSLKATANTVQTATLTTQSLLSLGAGDRLALVLVGTPTAVANVTVTINLLVPR